MQSTDIDSAPLHARRILSVLFLVLSLCGLLFLIQKNFWAPDQVLNCSASHGLASQNWTDDQTGAICHAPKANTVRAALSSKSKLRVPKVAILFLSKQSLRHETLWSQWFKLAQGQVPLDCLQNAVCEGYPLNHIEASDFKLFRSSLFSVYVHLPPNVSSLPETSLFFGTEISDRIEASWGSFELAQISRNLLAAALRDEDNQRFITLSESCIPLYPPQVVYSQLMYSSLSVINACTTRPGWSTDGYRWSWRISEATGGKLQEGMWRKSDQWLGLTRSHARMMVEDTEVAEAFRKHCYSGSDPDFQGWWRTCISDEHYFPTLLAYKGLEHETDCYGVLTRTEWCPTCDEQTRMHPRTYKADEIDNMLLRELRKEAGGCNANLAFKSAMSLIGKPGSLTLDRKQEKAYKLLAGCPLFARKFVDDAVLATLHTVLSLFNEDEHAALALNRTL